jgi:hypothetical protein
MTDDPNTDRDEPNPFDIPASELNVAIKRAIQKLWDIGFRHHVGEHSTVLTITRNARLLVLLGRQADQQTRRIVCLTWALLLLTVALLAVSIVLAGIAWHTDQRIRKLPEKIEPSSIPAATPP